MLTRHCLLTHHDFRICTGDSEPGKQNISSDVCHGRANKSPLSGEKPLNVALSYSDCNQLHCDDSELLELIAFESMLPKSNVIAILP